MNKLESAFWRMISRGTKKLGVGWERIENGCGLGTPDLQGCYDGRDIWVELKVEKNGKVNVSPEQVLFMKRREAHGGKAWIVCLGHVDGKETIRAWRECDAKGVRTSGWDYGAPREWQRSRNSYPWTEIIATLFN